LARLLSGNVGHPAAASLSDNRLRPRRSAAVESTRGSLAGRPGQALCRPRNNRASVSLHHPQLCQAQLLVQVLIGKTLVNPDPHPVFDT
jgi:hypothetical protein